MGDDRSQVDLASASPAWRWGQTAGGNLLHAIAASSGQEPRALAVCGVRVVPRSLTSAVGALPPLPLCHTCHHQQHESRPGK